MKEICTLLLKLYIICSRMQRVNLHARPSNIQVGCPTCCYQVCALDHAKGGTADLDYSSGPCHRNDLSDYSVWFVKNEYLIAKINVNRSLLPSDCVIG